MLAIEETEVPQGGRGRLGVLPLAKDGAGL